MRQSYIIRLTETWLTAEKEDSQQLDRYKKFYCNRQNRVGRGVGILTSSNLRTTVLSSYTTSAYSAIGTLSKINNYDDIITGCIYHPTPTLRLVTELSKKVPTCQIYNCWQLQPSASRGPV